jgi:CRISPR/Cas system-associated exonuclease Cas4 (RecB family)
MLKELIDQFYLNREEEREQHRFYITDAGKCPRAIFLKFKKAPREKMAPEVLRMFDHGDYIQMQILNALFSLGIVRAAEVNIPPQEIISGRADAIVTINNELYVVDFKSINSLIFKTLSSPREENVYQLQLYLHFFKIPKGILLYINKDTLELKEFLIYYDKNLAEKLLRDLISLKEKIDKNILPPRLANFPNDWQCKYCVFFEICQIAGKEELEWEKLKIKIETLKT